MKSGTKAIMEAQLEIFENDYPKSDYWIEFTCPEFTCVCPMTGFPDFAVLHLKYIPNDSCVELKSLKLYLNKFRDEGIFHEHVVNRILQEFVETVQPRAAYLTGDFNVRGNIKTIIKASYIMAGFTPVHW